MRESKSYASSLDYLIEATNRMLAHHPKIRLAIEPKPNEPVDVAYLPTIGHALAFAHLTSDPARVGCVVETAHCILAGLDPADEMEFALAQKKLWSVHLNDQNGLKFDQDKPFGSVNLRSAFDQVRVLERIASAPNRGLALPLMFIPFAPRQSNTHAPISATAGEPFSGFSKRSAPFDENRAGQLIAENDYQALDQMVLDHLLG